MTFSERSSQSYQGKKGLDDLSTSFLLYVIAGLANLIPVVGSIGEVVDLIALIFLIMAWRSLGRSDLSQSSDYRSTGSWLVRTIIICIVMVIVGAILFTAGLVTSIIASDVAAQLQNTTSTSTVPSFTVSQIPGFATFLDEMFGLALFIYVIWLSAWTKMCFSMKTLSEEISQPKLNLAGNLYIIQMMVGLASGIGSLFLVEHLIMTPSLLPTLSMNFAYGIFSYFALGGYGALLAGSLLAASAISAVASYLGYAALRKERASRRDASIPASPPPNPPSTDHERTLDVPMNYCPSCGQKLEPSVNGNYCPSCGSKLDGI